ncbi:hypothetical protein [Telmatospirillum siberiense]|uniref:Glutamine amidotransferase domain-containing protein n=1 Tax=Telmatospirillum siberiense TaxID=382514 RepID=A0A2N3PTT0_9PROT|nr:hypothetical protein [Telmatospirillum siberiense]PKU23809.1 hypothetical protein CWS72_15095 [Telmatospirillum siberiense]
MILPHLLFAPILPVWVLAGVAFLGLALSAWGWRGGLRAWWRLIPLAAVLLALANPRLTREEATAQDDIAVVMVDDSASMAVGDRHQQSERALAEVQERLKALPHLAVRIEHFRPAAGRDEGTRLFGALDRALADVPRRRLAGVVVISDGQIHDIPAKADTGVPLHLLLAGHPGERDRRLVVEKAPGFAIVGTSATLSFRIEDPGQAGSADVAIRRDGGAASHVTVPLNRSTTVEVPVEHAGPNIVEMEAAVAPDELTPVNNRAAVSISGVRDRLRVLLISGEPHAGERTWRNLLKADPSVDLVHFTILRPPEKDDRTPLRELALIAFPVRELFEEKLHGFDLIIFDRYRRRTVLPPAYYLNIVNYVKGGGALLVAAGPEFVKPDSPYNTPLADILPAVPDGRVVEEPFLPELTDVGRRHPVTADLSGSESEPPHWGRWLRVIASRPKAEGVTVMSGPQGLPLLMLDRVGDGRVAELMSDTVWLWARGWDGGGPQVELTRRLAHWLMKEPELEEEQLTADIRGERMHVQRRSLAKGDIDVTVTAPDGGQRKLHLADQGDGRSTGEMVIDQPGLWRIDDGQRVALSGAGLLNPVEMSELRATPDKLKPVVEASGGGWRWIADGVPDLRMVAPQARTAGSGWFGFRANGDKIVTAVHDSPLLPDWLLLVLSLGGLIVAWWREGR